ncbi:MAG: tyrosine-protein phosphatase [Hyphomicrobiaceae bacterium]|nr:tyrosine-protein phosphatase [Hyphomicrobiaceae bacterium]
MHRPAPQRRPRTAPSGQPSRPIESPLGRACAWIDLLLLDHGLVRLIYANRHRVTPRLWRSAQPTPGDLRREKARGLKTVICVRSGPTLAAWPLELEACETLGLELHKVGIRGREAPRKGDLLALLDLFTAIEYPVLIHCKSGADRTGFICAVYLMAIEGRCPEEAAAQLSWRYGHLRRSRAGILGEVIDAYRRQGASRGVAFRQWVETGYDPQEIARTFRPRLSARLIADFLLRRET